MGHFKKLLSFRVNRFLVVGAGNTIINFAVLNSAFYSLHLNKITASIIATCCAIAFSFTFNRSFVFRDKSQPVRKFVVFSLVTAAGVLVIQTSVYAICVHLLTGRSNLMQINVSNLIASISVALWNYNGYRLLVFKKVNTKFPNNGEIAEKESNEAV